MAQFSLFRVLFFLLVTVIGLAASALPTENCSYQGTTNSYGGVIGVKTSVSATNPDDVQVRVQISIQATAFFIAEKYFIDEISQWHDGVLIRVGSNIRDIRNNSVRTQRWDLFEVKNQEIEGYRIQGKTLQDFQAQHPQFVKHWDPSAFADDWMQDYAQGQGERRPDLDLPHAAYVSDILTPFSLAFHWVRFLKPEAQVRPVFVPGEKLNQRMDINLLQPAVQADHGLLWQFPLNSNGIQTPPDRPAQVLVSGTGEIESFLVTIQSPMGAIEGKLRRTCQ